MSAKYELARVKLGELLDAIKRAQDAHTDAETVRHLNEAKWHRSQFDRHLEKLEEDAEELRCHFSLSFGRGDFNGPRSAFDSALIASGTERSKFINNLIRDTKYCADILSNLRPCP